MESIQHTPISTDGAHRPIPHDLPGDPGIRAAIDRWDNYHPTLVTTGDVDDTALHLATSYVRPRPLPRRTPGATLTFRPLPPELAEQGWDEDDNRPVVPPKPIPGQRPASDQATQVPGPRRSPEQPQPKIPAPRGQAYDAIVIGAHHAHTVFGHAA